MGSSNPSHDDNRNGEPRYIFPRGRVSQRPRMSSSDQKIYEKVWKIFYKQIRTPHTGRAAQ